MLPNPSISTLTPSTVVTSDGFGSIFSSSSSSSGLPSPDSEAARASMLPTPSRALQHISSLARHIATQGLIQGIGSDITIHVFDKTYHLHRLILTQSSYFEAMFQRGPWKERESQVVEIKFDDTNISQEGFEIAIGSLYGVWTEEEDSINNSSNSDDRTLGPATSTSPVTATNTATIKTTSDGNSNDNNIRSNKDYIGAGGRGGEVTKNNYIMRSTMSLSSKNALSVLASGAYLGIDELCERCCAFIIRTLSTLNVTRMVEFTHQTNYYPWSARIADACHTFLCRNGYDDPKIKCLQVFEALPASWLVNVIGSDAFWVPGEWERYKLCREIVHSRRRKAMARKKKRQDLPSSSRQTITTSTHDLQQHPSSQNTVFEMEEDEDEIVYDTLFSTSIIYMHMSFEQLQIILRDIDPLTGERFTRSEVIHEALWHQTELRAMIDRSVKDDGPLDVFDFEDHNQQQNQESDVREKRDWSIPDQDRTLIGDISSPSQRLELADASLSSSNVPNKITPNKRCSLYAPFRISVEFGDIDQLQDNVRSPSDMFFYAGSYWDVYIQKLPSPKGVQLGVYLHRRKFPDNTLVTKPPRQPTHAFTFPSAPSSSVTQSTGASLEPRANNTPHSNNPSLSFALWSTWGFRAANQIHQQEHTVRTVSSLSSSPPSPKSSSTHSPFFVRSDSEEENEDEDDLPNKEHHALLTIDESSIVSMKRSFSYYVDKREKVRTWFKIFAASLGPNHTITQFQSSPDDFFTMQSWGWRSSSLCSPNYMPVTSKDYDEAKFTSVCCGFDSWRQNSSDSSDDTREGSSNCSSLGNNKGRETEKDMGKDLNSTSESFLVDMPQQQQQQQQHRQKKKGEQKSKGIRQNTKATTTATRGFEWDVKDGHDDMSGTSPYKKDPLPECNCEAQRIYGRHHHHLQPQTLKFSI
ncbi:hypothetical protein BX616_005287, partial [Lobosporangium transversale]